ncbi:MAG: hypothetical protein JRC66_08430 [Deltaproteobacteria bacterium]|nr:hypothetical protein [Deltaproteobacteria bacterium]
MTAFVPIRSKYLGSFTSNPTPTEPGQWWYRSDLGLFAYWDGSTIRYLGGMGGRIAEGSVTTVYDTGGDKPIQVSVPVLTSISYILDIRFTADPAVDPGKPVNIVVTGNVVGFTLVGLGAGTTLTTTAVVTGL